MSALPSDRAQAALLRGLKGLVGPFTLLAARTTPWMSATFDGARHRFAIRLEGNDAAIRAARLRAELAEAEIPIRGGFVADIVVTVRLDEATPVLGIEALTIEEAGDAVSDGEVDAPRIGFSRGDRRVG